MGSEIILTRLHTIYSKIIDCSLYTTRQYIQCMDDCTNSQMKYPHLQGHPIQCYLFSLPCTSDLLYLRTLAPHFPAIRHIVMDIYEVQRNDAKITEIHCALHHGHLEKILGILQMACTTAMSQYDVSAEVLNEMKTISTILIKRLFHNIITGVRIYLSILAYHAINCAFYGSVHR